MNPKRMIKLSARLKYVRAHFDLSQGELAEKAGTTQQAIQQAEAGKARQPRYLHRLARELDIPIDWLIFGEAVGEEKLTENKKLSQGFQDKSTDVLNSFFSMPPKDQKLIYELMKSREKK